jgi:hypothetical protein
VRIKHKVNVKIYDDTALKDALFGLDDTLAEETIDAFDVQVSGRFSVSTIEELSLGDVATALGMFIKVDADATLRLNDSFDLALKVASGASYARFFFEGTITKIELTAASGTVTGVYCVWGTAD